MTPSPVLTLGDVEEPHAGPGGADDARRAVDQQRVALADLQLVEYADRGLDGYGQCGGGVPVEVGGFSAKVAGQRVVGVPAG